LCCTAGNNYEVPEALTNCLKAITAPPNTAENVAAQMACEETYGKTNYRNSIIAINIGSGKIK
jgi:hypothetical protein